MSTAKRNHKKQVDELINELNKLGKNRRVPKVIAQKFIEESAFWEDHPSGPVRAPNQCGNVFGSETNWRIQFGRNTFMVGKAVWKCRQRLYDFLQNNRSNTKLSQRDLGREKQKLKYDIRNSVVDPFGNEYCYPLHMKFGVHSIRPNNFIDCLFKIVPIERILSKPSEIIDQTMNTKLAETTLKKRLPKSAKKHLKKALEAEGLTARVDNAILSLECIDRKLRESHRDMPQSVFSALTRAVVANGRSIKGYRSGISRLISIRDAVIIKENKASQNSPEEIMKITREIAEMAGFALPYG